MLVSNQTAQACKAWAALQFDTYVQWSFAPPRAKGKQWAAALRIDIQGQPLPDIEWAADKVRAYIYVYGASGIAGGEVFSSPWAHYARAAAARYLT